MSPFTEEVLKSLAFLRRAIDDVRHVDTELSETLTAVTDDLVYNLEQQMMLLFCNVGAKKKEEELALLRGTTNEALAEFYSSIAAAKKRTNGGSEGSEADDTNGTSSPGGGHAAQQGHAGGGHNAIVTPEAQARKACSSSLYLMVEAVAHHVQAERAAVYLLQKGTGALRVVASAPDTTCVKRGAFVATHQGIVGSVFTTGVSVRSDVIDEETRKDYVVAVDSNLGFGRTHNTLVFPIVDPSTNAPIGVLECSNKVHGAPWSAWDEALMYHTASLMWFVLMYYETDWHGGGAVFHPTALHAIKPYRPAARSKELEKTGLKTAVEMKPPQLIVRLTRPVAPHPLGTNAPKTELGALLRTINGGGGGSAATSATTTTGAAASSTSWGGSGDNTVLTLLNIREMRSFLEKLEEAHRSMLNDLVQLQERESTAKLDAQKKGLRIRVLEENVATLHTQLVDAKQQLMQQSFSPMYDANAGDYGFMPPQNLQAPVGASTQQLLRNASMVAQTSSSNLGQYVGGGGGSMALPPIAGATSSAGFRVSYIDDGSGAGSAASPKSPTLGSSASGVMFPATSFARMPSSAHFGTLSSPNLLGSASGQSGAVATSPQQQLARIGAAIANMRAAVMADSVAVMRVRQDQSKTPDPTRRASSTNVASAGVGGGASAPRSTSGFGSSSAKSKPGRR